MAKLIFRMNQSLDGYVDHQKMPSGPTIFVTGWSKCAI